MEKIVIANLKMNLEEKQVLEYIKKINEDKYNVNLYIAPSFIYLNQFKSNNYKLTAQDLSCNNNGSFTGEISAKQLKSIGVDSVIIGHIERRKNFNETDEIINKKIKLAIKNNLNVILCIGEREKMPMDLLKEFLINQIETCLKGINVNNIIIAYEPEYAISNDKFIFDYDNLRKIYKFIKKHYNYKIIYGGGVGKNISEICNIFDGVIVGKKSLNVEEFKLLIKKIA